MPNCMAEGGHEVDEIFAVCEENGYNLGVEEYPKGCVCLWLGLLVRGFEDLH